MEGKEMKDGVVEIKPAHFLYEQGNLICLSISNLYDSLLFFQLFIILDVEHMLLWYSSSQQKQCLSHFILFADTELVVYSIGILESKKEEKTIQQN